MFCLATWIYGILIIFLRHRERREKTTDIQILSYETLSIVEGNITAWSPSVQLNLGLRFLSPSIERFSREQEFRIRHSCSNAPSPSSPGSSIDWHKR
jgi:hypothetical protein